MKQLLQYRVIYITSLLCITVSLFCKEKQPVPQYNKSSPEKRTARIHSVRPRILRTIPHDSTAFTQGLFLYSGLLYESTGLYGVSQLRVIDTADGSVITTRHVDSSFFAEGCALFQNTIFQLTWREHTCLVYDIDKLTLLKTGTYSGEGWGLCTHDKQPFFFMSNGTDTLYKRDRHFAITEKVPVTYNETPLTNLNELEYARGHIYANVWFSDSIFKIDPKSGKVIRIVDCIELVEQETPTSDQNVLNGIAYDKTNNRFYLTGKNWKTIFVVEIE